MEINQPTTIETMTSPPSNHVPIAEAIFAWVDESREYRKQTHSELQFSIDQLNTTTSEMNGLMRALEVALTGDELGNPGIVARQNNLQGQIDQDRSDRKKADERLHDRIDELENWKNRLIGIGIGIGGISGTVVAILTQVFNSSSTP